LLHCCQPPNLHGRFRSKTPKVASH
jgi:hypothetical protein